MGRYDFSCNTGMDLLSYDGLWDNVRIYCYWKNNGWTYHMSGIYGWVTCDGTERLVYENGYPDFTSDNYGQYLLGYSDFSIRREHSNKTWGYSARLQSNSSYASGERSSDTGYYTTGAVTHTVISYDANGGSGAPGNQDKWYGEALYLSNTRPSRTGHSFQRWNTASNGSGTNYNPGDNYQPDPGGTVTLYAIWKADTYSVSYNANGGSGAPANQTKTYGQNLTLSSTIPTRAGYNFKGWGTSSSGPVSYNAGGTYTNNAAVILYAIWELAYISPRINNFAAQRCTSNGTADESGTYIKVTFSWATDKTISTVKIQWKNQTASSWTDVTVTASGTSGSVSQIIGGGNVSVESSYLVKCYVQDSQTGTGVVNRTDSSEIAISTVAYPIDVRKQGMGVAFGKVAESDDLFDVNFVGRFRKGAKGPNNHYYIERNNFKIPNTGTSNVWYYLGKIRMSSQGDIARFNIFCGPGQNADPSQNVFITIEMKKGHQSTASTTDYVGVTWETHVLSAKTGTAVRNVNVKVLCNQVQYLDVYIFFPWSYAIGYYEVEGKYDSFNRGDEQSYSTSEPTGGVEQPISRKHPYKTLYENYSGNTGTVTLSENAANFRFLEIYVLSTSDSGTGYAQNCTRVWDPNGKSAWLSTGYCNTSDFNTKICSALISGTQITRPYGYWEFNDSTRSSTNFVGITKVIGYYNDDY